jgi:RHS repeat-associated protein
VNRLLSKTADAYFVTNHIGAAAESFTYTATGKRATMADASGTTTYGYDTRDRLVTKATPEGSLSYSYDAAGDVKTIQSSNAGGASMAYGYDALDRLNAVTDANGATTYSYDAVGNLGTVTYPNGVAHSYTYDTRNRLTNLGVRGTVNGAPGAIASYGYTLDAAGHRTSVTELSGRKVNYGYDSIYRLTSETISSDPNAMNGAVSCVYDAVGNRTQKTSTLPGYPGGLSNYNANDELTTDTYDADGNTTASQGLGYAYDFENRLVQAGAGISIVYDGDGNRVSKTVTGVTTKYLVDDLNPTGYAQVVDELQSTTVIRTYSWGLDLISEVFPAGSPLATGHSPLSYYVFDGHGSVRALTNSSGAVTDSYDFDAFGVLIHSSTTLSSPTPNNYLFAGEQFDPDLNLYYNRARYLNINTGRFWTMDTEEGQDRDPLSLHKYLYAEGDSVDNVDTSGNEIDEIEGSFAVSETINAIPTISTTVTGAISRSLLYHVVVVTLPTGSTYEPLSKVKNSDQAVIAGVAVNTPIRIAVPPGIDPQTMVDQWNSGSVWSSRSALNPRTWLAFKKFWSDPNNNFKNQKKIFDAFGNFELGATGAAAFFGLPILEAEADRLHGGTNDPINRADIQSGFEAIEKGGKLSTTTERLVP